MILTKGYAKIDRLKKRIKVIQGGQGASKTYSILQNIIITALSSKVKATIVTETYPQLKDGVIADVKNILEDEKGFNFNQIYNRSEKNLFLGESILQFRNIDNKDFHNSKGARREILFINEANRTSWESVEQLITRSKSVFIDYNPDREFWVHDRILVDEVYKNSTDFIALTFQDNSEIPEEELTEILTRIKASKLPGATSQLKNWVRVFAYGELGILSERQIYQYEFIDKIPDDAVKIPSGMDFGVSPDPTICIDVWNKGNNLYIDERFCLNNLLPEKLSGAERLSIVDEMDLIEFQKGHLIVADSSGATEIKDLNKHGYNVKGVKKPPGSVMAGVNKLRGYNLFITNRSVNMKHGIESWHFKVDGNGKIIPEPDGHEPDGLAALRYVIMYWTKKHAKIY